MRIKGNEQPGGVVIIFLVFRDKLEAASNDVYDYNIVAVWFPSIYWFHTDLFRRPDKMERRLRL